MTRILSIGYQINKRLYSDSNDFTVPYLLVKKKTSTSHLSFWLVAFKM